MELSDKCERGLRYCHLACARVGECIEKTSIVEAVTLPDLKMAIAVIGFTQIMWNK